MRRHATSASSRSPDEPSDRMGRLVAAASSGGGRAMLQDGRPHEHFHCGCRPPCGARAVPSLIGCASTRDLRLRLSGQEAIAAEILAVPPRRATATADSCRRATERSNPEECFPVSFTRKGVKRSFQADTATGTIAAANKPIPSAQTRERSSRPPLASAIADAMCVTSEGR